MSAMDSELAWAVPGLSLSEKAILAFITCKARSNLGDLFWWGQAAMSKTLGVSKDTLQRALKVLEQRGFISRQPRYEETANGTLQRRSDLITVHLDVMREAAVTLPDESDEPQGVAAQSGHLAARRGQGGRTQRPGVAAHSGDPGRTVRQQNPGSEPGNKNPGKRTLESEPASAHQSGIEDEQARQIRDLEAYISRSALNTATDPQQLPGQTDVLGALTDHAEARKAS